MRDSVKGGALTEVTFLILLSLYEPNHGYGIMKFIEDKTAGRLRLGAGSLYGALSTLCKKTWIQPYVDTGRKKEYVITPLGKQVVRNEIKRMREVLFIADAIEGGNCHE